MKNQKNKIKLKSKWLKLQKSKLNLLSFNKNMVFRILRKNNKSPIIMLSSPNLKKVINMNKNLTSL